MRRIPLSRRLARTFASLLALGLMSMSLLSAAAEAAVVVVHGPGPGSLPSAVLQWRTRMLKTRLPKPGCYSAAFPNTAWTSQNCVAAPPNPLSVGNGTDAIAQIASGSIASASGSFADITGLTQENDVGNSFTFGGTNDFSLQQNTNQFPTSTSNGFIQKGGSTTNPCAGNACTGWQQFVLSNYASVSPIGTNLYMQFWLIGYLGANGACPSSQIPGSWQSGIAGQWRTSGNSCFINGPAASVPIQNAADLGSLALTASVDFTGLDVAFLSTPNQIYAVGLPTNFLGMNQSWTQAEFNVFGLWNSSLAKFNAGTTLTVQEDLSAAGAGPASASCLSGGTTGETNNLNLWCPCFSGGSEIFFTETNVNPPTCACPAGLTWSQGSSSCVCPVSGQVIGSNGQCACADSGQIVVSNACTCSVGGAVPVNGACACPASQQTVVNNQCTCPVVGAQAIGGKCACPAPEQTIVKNACTCPSGLVVVEKSGHWHCGCPGNQLLIGGKCGCGNSTGVSLTRGSCTCDDGGVAEVNALGTGFICTIHNPVNPVCAHDPYRCNCGSGGAPACPPPLLKNIPK